jgi:hypothetical protein
MNMSRMREFDTFHLVHALLGIQAEESVGIRNRRNASL